MILQIEENCNDFVRTHKFMKEWYNARATVVKNLSTVKRPVTRFGGGDIRALLNSIIYSRPLSVCWDLNLQDALFWTLLYATGARPGEFENRGSCKFKRSEEHTSELQS